MKQRKSVGGTIAFLFHLYNAVDNILLFVYEILFVFVNKNEKTTLMSDQSSSI